MASPVLMSIIADTMLAPPPGLLNTKAKVCDAPLPELGLTDTAASGPLLLLAPVTAKLAVALLLKDPLVPVTVTV